MKKLKLVPIRTKQENEIRKAGRLLKEYCNGFDSCLGCPFQDSPFLNGQCVILEIAGWMEGLSCDDE